ncbi:transporter substrate-binding domain-containing protein [Shewanella aegiceratis]|uniref:transporter substrate-binding domain-containing protein n=1 Tax=Shewanella aegiceratis TaxID=2864203 RepID=UPI001C65DE77|nr:transporter substrate-binding domain-containing protein [Shewanella aegiceratis]QYJ81265.1 transporter substrate-binding domain-containing protein [Shewanella aegiceratis]
MHYFAYKTQLLVALLLFLSLPALAQHTPAARCGVATGFPPYQFSAGGETTGFDADVARLIFKRLGMPFQFRQQAWDLVFNELRFGDIELIAGMEINALRTKFFDFTRPYYYRYDVIFILEDNQQITKLEDLHNQFVSGDRHSYIETHWKELGTLYDFRIIATPSKERSMQLLKEGKIQAAIMPKAVGLYLAQQMGIEVKILDNPDPGSPVAFAVKRGNHQLLAQIDEALEALISEGEIQRLYEKWFPEHPQRHDEKADEVQGAPLTS